MKELSSAKSIFQNLLERVKLKNEVKIISDTFSKISSNSERVDFSAKLLKENCLFPELLIDKKSDEIAFKLREQGNAKFKQKKLKEAVYFYTESLGYAATSQEYSKALANRSAALFEMKLFKECLNDIEDALDSNYPEELQPKLLKRKEKSLQMSHTSIFLDIRVPDIPISSKSTNIECASNSIQIKYSESQGRHIIAVKDIKIGEILAVEQPFCHILSKEHLNHCHECLKFSFNLLPCSNCTRVFYCDKICRKNASKYHKYECNIIKTLRSLEMDKMKLLPLKIALIANKDSCQTDINDVYKSDRYEEIHNLVANTENRTVADLFERSTFAAIIYFLVKNHTNFFDEHNEESFKELLLLHMQTAPCNFHEISELSRNDEGFYESEEIGAGAYSFLSLFNHSCNPNVVRHCYGSTVVVRAIRSIPVGEQCFDNYGYHFAVMPRKERAQYLKSQYFFDCECHPCKNDWPLLDDLPLKQEETNVTDEDITKLRNGDKVAAFEVMDKLLPKMGKLEETNPNRLFFQMQEVLKQCYGLLGNVNIY